MNWKFYLIGTLMTVASGYAGADDSVPLVLPSELNCKQVYSTDAEWTPATIKISNVGNEKITLGEFDAHLQVFPRGGGKAMSVAKSEEETDRVLINEFHESHDWSHIEFYGGSLTKLANGEAKVAVGHYAVGYSWGTDHVDAEAIYECSK